MATADGVGRSSSPPSIVKRERSGEKGTPAPPCRGNDASPLASAPKNAVFTKAEVAMAWAM
ncbi:MAG UNVERIFIED_CONTAM: hypothetical protein LVT10_01375 [Anaerolineae bacterium]